MYTLNDTKNNINTYIFMDVTGFEPVTPSMSRMYSNQLSYTSKFLQLIKDSTAYSTRQVKSII